MHKDLMRRIEKLEQKGARTDQFQARLRVWAGRLGVPEQAFLRAAESYEEQLRRELADDGAVTWETFLLLRDIAASALVGLGVVLRTETGRGLTRGIRYLLSVPS